MHFPIILLIILIWNKDFPPRLKLTNEVKSILIEYAGKCINIKALKGKENYSLLYRLQGPSLRSTLIASAEFSVPRLILLGMGKDLQPGVLSLGPLRLCVPLNIVLWYVPRGIIPTFE